MHPIRKRRLAVTSNAAQEPDPYGARSNWQLLFDGTFGPFFWAQLLSTVGIWVNNITAAILVFALTRSTLMVGLVSVAQFAPQVALGPWSGAVADRGDRRRQVVSGRIISAAGSGLLAVAIALGTVTGTAGAVLVISAAAIVGSGYAIGSPAMHAMLPALVRPNELSGAVALNSLPFTIGRAVGPALGAALAVSLGYAAGFGIAACSHLVFAAVLIRLSIRDVARRTGQDGRVQAAVRYAFADRPSRYLLIGIATIGIATIGIGADPVITLTPLLADQLGGGAQLVGIMASVFGVGAGLAYVFLGWWQARFRLARTGSTGLSVFSISLLLLAATPGPTTAVLALGLSGIGMTLALTSQTTLLQMRVPEELRGRIMALWSVAYLGSRPLAAACNGAVADVFSPSVALVVVAGVLAVGAAMTRSSHLAS